ncbi:MAG: DUF1501 domain-containing protein [Thermoanaerobaculales bacterium]|jgi:uncharacterized protein (DUF1501 family)|nr:DUF1501 domain-containing protein [Thermoanaerobaculales bacterium]
MTTRRPSFAPTRRGFVAGCLGTVAAAAAEPRSLWAASTDRDILVAVFLRGGMDGLSLLPPLAGSDRDLYEAARPALAIPLAGDGAALTLDGDVGLHPAAAPLMPIFNAGRMAVVQATGMHHPTRSHFEAQDFMELGTPGEKTITTGWLHRHLVSATNLPSEILIPAMAAGGMQPMSLLGSGETLTIDDPELFTFATGPWRWLDEQRRAMERIYGLHTSVVNAAGTQSMNAVDIVATHVTGGYVPAGGAVYLDDETGGRFRLAAQMLSLDLGIRVVAIDVDSWDTHENQGNGPGGVFNGLVSSFASGLSAFLTDMAARPVGERLTVVVMTEFGRRLVENGDAGTDHGHAAPMLVLGGNVVGGLHGLWPGLEPDELFEGVDLEVTTDYRQVLSEILIERLGNRRIGEVFPGYASYEPLGVVHGSDRPPIYQDHRSGGTGRVGP